MKKSKIGEAEEIKGKLREKIINGKESALISKELRNNKYKKPDRRNYRGTWKKRMG